MMMDKVNCSRIRMLNRLPSRYTNLTGIIITGPKWPEPVEIKKVDYTGDYVHIVGATTLSSYHIDSINTN